MPVYLLDRTDTFPPATEAEASGLLAVGGDLRPSRLLRAYSEGIFPWYSEGEPILWFSPDPRTVIETDRVRIGRGRTARRLTPASGMMGSCNVTFSRGINSNLDDFIKHGVKVVGISTDSVESHSNFCSKLKLNFSLLADLDKTVSKQFDAVNFLGINKRLLVLIGTDKRVLWTDSTMSFTYIKTEEILEKVKLFSIKEMT